MSQSQPFIETAARIGSRLSRDARWFRGKCNWLGCSNEPVDHQWGVVLRALGPDLYSGTSGVGLFLARLWSHTGEPMHRRVAIGALHQALSRADEVPTDMRAGLYSGWLGIAHALCVAAQILELDEFLDAARGLARASVGQISAGPRLDVIAGDAGAIIALLMLRGALSDDCLL